jgi:hypothetical protein
MICDNLNVYWNKKNQGHMGWSPGPTHYKLTTITTQLPALTSCEVNLCYSYTKGKTFKVHISDTKAHWMKWRDRCLFISCLLYIDPIFVQVPSPKSDDLSLQVAKSHCWGMLLSYDSGYKASTGKSDHNKYTVINNITVIYIQVAQND